MLSQEISKRWIDFFASRGHTVVPSASLISNEPGAMFTHRRYGAVHSLLPGP